MKDGSRLMKDNKLWGHMNYAKVYAQLSIEGNNIIKASVDIIYQVNQGINPCQQIHIAQHLLNIAYSRNRSRP